MCRLCRFSNFEMGTENIEKSNHQNSSPKSNDEVVTIPITIDENNVLEGAREILKIIRPTWNEDNIKFKLFTDGITNKLVGCYHEDPQSSTDFQQSSEITKLSTGYEDMVLVRVYGRRTDLLIDRKEETRNIQLLHSHGFAPCLYAIFRNGLAYEYAPGVTLTSETVAEPQIWTLIARHMAEMHKMEFDSGSDEKQPMLWGKVQQFLDILPENYSNSQIDERVKQNFLPIHQLKEEFAELYKHLVALNSPTVFCHNDLLLGNVIYEKSTDRITFIDYEYAGQNFQAYDIGNHFTEFAGVDVVDYRHYPSKEFQLEWLRCYLEVYHGQTKVITERDVHVLYVQTNKFALASHFLWAIWALIQAENSSIDFDFVTFAQMRYNEYMARKDTFLALSYNG